MSTILNMASTTLFFIAFLALSNEVTRLKHKLAEVETKLELLKAAK